MTATVSVVIPYFNASRTIEDAVSSVRLQTLPVDEIVLVDDGSRPEEARALDRYADSCTIIRLAANGGPSMARNVGIVAARGAWIAFLDADDLWTPDKIQRQLDYIVRHPECRAIHSGVRNIALDGEETIALKSPVTFESFLEFPCPIFLPTVMMLRSALIEAGLFDQTKRCCEDLDLWMRFCSKDTIHCVPEPLLIRRVQPGGLSRDDQTFWVQADRVYRDFHWMFADQAGARETRNRLHADFLLRAIYARDFKLLGTILWRAFARDITVTQVMRKVTHDLVKGRFARLREKTVRRAPPVEPAEPYLS